MKKTAFKILPVTTRRGARELDSIDIAVWGSKDPQHHRFFGCFLGYGMRVYRLVVGGKTVGALVTGYPTSANLMEVEEIMVLPGFQRRGFGKKLLTFARKEARRRGHRGIVVEVDLQNPHAIKWYRRVGMKTVGHVVVDNEKAWAEEERVIRNGKGGK